MNEVLANQLNNEAPSSGMQNKLIFKIGIENRQGECYLEIKSIYQITHMTYPPIIGYRMTAEVCSDIMDQGKNNTIDLYLSHEQIYGTVDFSEVICRNIVYELYAMDGSNYHVSPYFPPETMRVIIQRNFQQLIIRYENRIRGFTGLSNGMDFWSPINFHGRAMINTDYYVYNHGDVLLTNNAKINLSFTLKLQIKVMHHFKQIKSKDKRRFMFLYFHMCYMASLFIPLDQSMILVIDTDARIREDLITLMFGDNRGIWQEFAQPDMSENKLNEIYKCTKDLPFVFDVYDAKVRHKFESVIEKALPRNDGSMTPFTVPIYAVPVAVSSQPGFCENFIHLTINPNELDFSMESMTCDIEYMRYFAALHRELHPLNINPNTILPFTNSYQIHRKRVNANQEPTIYAVFRTLNEFLHTFYGKNSTNNNDLREMHADLFDEDIDTFLSRFMPSLKLDTSFHRDHFYEAIGKLVASGDITVYDHERGRFDDCVSRDVFESEACLFHTKDSWLLNETAMQSLTIAISENCSTTKLLHMLKSQKVLSDHRINRDSFQARRRIYFYEGDYVDAGLYEVYPRDGIIPVDEDSYSWDKVHDGLHFHLGKNVATGDEMYWDFDSESNINHHMLITGGSGAGKSCFLEGLVSQAMEQKITTIVFHQQGVPPCGDHVINVVKDRPGLVCFDEDYLDHSIVAERLASALNLTVNQKARISEAYESYLDQKTGSSEDSDLPAGDPSVHDFIEILSTNKKLFKEVTPTIRHKLCYFSGMNTASAQIMKWSDYEGKTIILDFRDAPDEDWYKYNAELCLLDLFRYRQLCTPGTGRAAPMIIISDEFQNMNTKNNAALEKITREGRKYGISLWIASQLIENDAKSRLKAITDQCSMKVYFMAGTEHSKKIANLLGISSSEKMRMLTMMRSLKKQEYVFQLNGKTPHKCIANEVKSLE